MGVSKIPAINSDNNMIRLSALAEEEAEKRIRDGSASDSLLIQTMKYGTRMYQLEVEKLISEQELMKQKIENYKLAATVEEDIKEVINALKGYRIKDDEDDEDGYDLYE